MARKNSKLTREHRAKISAAMKARWAVETPPTPPEPEPDSPRRLARPMLHGWPVPKPGRRF